MTPQELNRDIMRLLKRARKYVGPYDGAEEAAIGKELDRLYSADDTFEYMSHRSMKIMLRLNLRFRVIALHRFGARIKLEDL
jgi:hypothetical protein